MQRLRTLVMRQRALAALVLAAALLLRAAVPAGYMFAPAQDGRTLAVTVCTGSAPQQIELALPGKGSTQREHQAKDGPCAFAGLGALAANGDGPVLTLAPQPSESTPLAALVAAVGRGLAAPPPPQTGPPSLA